MLVLKSVERQDGSFLTIFAAKDWLRQCVHFCAGDYSEPFVLEPNIVFARPTHHHATTLERLSSSEERLQLQAIAAHLINCQIFIDTEAHKHLIVVRSSSELNAGDIQHIRSIVNAPDESVTFDMADANHQEVVEAFYDTTYQSLTMCRYVATSFATSQPNRLR